MYETRNAFVFQSFRRNQFFEIYPELCDLANCSSAWFQVCRILVFARREREKKQIEDVRIFATFLTVACFVFIIYATQNDRKRNYWVNSPHRPTFHIYLLSDRMETINAKCCRPIPESITISSADGQADGWWQEISVHPAPNVTTSPADRVQAPLSRCACLSYGFTYIHKSIE